ncbi:hypothetical protein SAMN02745857_02217 [Andreprevotia lacus DSM 23236]|jgi:hypothetical protein|uniref:Uncharacterized protein n=1 Tax=Andreprevotia lacus DSM 23236 TaxID=1121001 RepID=A0A1W1XPW3_9NEIS|nr:hypothetical protein [Andreprevotia lacus]SMC25571.1 hypothetical protein SAMN02745857_02217 [Andreprevotia lacus DSM 23236]
MKPEFNQVMASFLGLLQRQGLPAQIVWVRPEQAIYGARKGWLILPSHGYDVAEIAARYQAACSSDWGLRFSVLCVHEHTSYCLLKIPADELAAEYALLAADVVKLSVPVPVPAARAASGILQIGWWRLREHLSYRQWKQAAFELA